MDNSWEMVAESIPQMVWVVSPDGYVEYLNQRDRLHSGGPQDLSLNDIASDVLHPDDAPAFRRAWHEAVQAGAPFASEYRIRQVDGHYRWHHGQGRPIRDGSGAITRWIVSTTDVEDYKRSEAVLQETVERLSEANKALREAGERLAEAQRLAHVGSWSVDVVTGERQWSDELYRLLGHNPADGEPDQERFFERLHPEDAGRVRDAFLAQLSRAEPWDDEFRVLLPGGALRWLTAHTEPVLGDAGEVVRIHGTSQDVTEGRLAEERLRFQAGLLEAVGEAVIATDLEGNVIYWGPGAEEVYGWPAEETRGRSIIDLIPTVDRSYDAAQLRSRWDGGGRWAGTIRLRRRDGSILMAEVTRSSVCDEQGRLVALIGTSSDVTERERAIAELERAHRRAEEAATLLGTLQAEAPVGFGFVDRGLRLVRLNDEMAAILGAPIDDVVGRDLAEVLPSALWEHLEPVYRQILAGGEAVRGQRVIERQGTNGGMREITTCHYPVHVGGEIIGVGVVLHDITERARSEGLRLAVMSQVAEGVCTLDRDGRLIYMNTAASKMLGWTEGELRGMYMEEVVGLPDFEVPLVGADAAPSQEADVRSEHLGGGIFIRRDMSTFPAAYSTAPLHIGASLEGWVVVFRDLSEPGSSPNVIRVVIVDPDTTATHSFKALLERHDGIEVVGAATTSASGLRLAEELRPAVVLVNFDLPDRSGVTTASMIKYANPSTNVILMTAKHDDSIALASIQAGCAGLLDKSRAWVELVSAVRAAYHGETIISQGELQRVVTKVRGGGHHGRATQLTDREEEVLALMREGLSNAQVAERLGVTSNTVRNHVQRILFKLNVHSKLEAVVVTSREGVPHDGD